MKIDERTLNKPSLHLISADECQMEGTSQRSIIMSDKEVKEYMMINLM